MLPVLLSLGPIKIYSYGLFLFVGLFLGLYWWWKLGRDEHLDEVNLFDAWFIGILAFFIGGRGIYVILHTETVNNIYRALGFLAFPGLSVIGGMLTAILSTLLTARYNEWEVWKVLDNLAVALSVVFVFGSIGGLLNRGLFLSDLTLVFFSLISFFILSKVRKEFRFYAWYKRDASVVKDGLTASFFVGLAGLYFMTNGFLHDGARLGFVPLEFLGGLFLLLISTLFVYTRHGKKHSELLHWFKRRK